MVYIFMEATSAGDSTFCTEQTSNYMYDRVKFIDEFILRCTFCMNQTVLRPLFIQRFMHEYMWQYPSILSDMNQHRVLLTDEKS